MIPAPGGATVVLRPASGRDGALLGRLAQLDSAARLTGDVIVAECEGEAVAAIELATGAVTANPFKPTARVTAMLEVRRRQLLETTPAPGPRRRFRLRPRAAG